MGEQALRVEEQLIQDEAVMSNYAQDQEELQAQIEDGHLQDFESVEPSSVLVIEAEAIAVAAIAKVPKTHQKPPAHARTYVDDSHKNYMQEVNEYPLLTKAQEVEHAQNIEKGKAAQLRIADAEEAGHQPSDKDLEAVSIGQNSREMLINANLRLVVSIATKFSASRLELADRIQEGNFGLLTAVDKYEWQKGFKFSTYATWWIRQAVSRGIANTENTVRIPVHTGEDIHKLRKVRQKFSSYKSVKPTIEELAEQTGQSVEKVVELLGYENGSYTTSFDRPLTFEGDATIGDSIKDPKASAAFDDTDDKLSATPIIESLGMLNDREQDIIKRSFGLDDGDSQKLVDIAEEYNLSCERIRQIRAKAMQKLRIATLGLARYKELYES